MVCRILLFSCFSVHGVNVQIVMCDNVSTTVKNYMKAQHACMCVCVCARISSRV